MEKRRKTSRNPPKIDSGGPAEAKSYSAREGARIAGVSIDTLKEMCRRGQLPHFYTPGRHLRVPAEGLTGLTAKPQTQIGTGGSTFVLQSYRNRIDELNLEAQELRAKRELERLKAEQEEEQNRRMDAVKAHEAERQREAERVRLEQACQAEREEQERTRRAWVAGWVDYGLSLVPNDTPQEIELEIHGAIDEVLARLEAEQPQHLVERQVTLAVEKSLGPWKCQQLLKREERKAWEALAKAWRFEGFSQDGLDEISEPLRTALGQEIASATQGLSPGSSPDIEAARQLAIERVLRPYRRDHRLQQTIQAALREIRPFLEELREGGWIPLEQRDVEFCAQRLEPNLRAILEAQGRNRELTEAEAKNLVRRAIDEELRVA